MAFHKYKLIEIIHKEPHEDIPRVIIVTGRLEIIVVYHQLRPEISIPRTRQHSHYSFILRNQIKSGKIFALVQSRMNPPHIDFVISII